LLVGKHQECGISSIDIHESLEDTKRGSQKQSIEEGSASQCPAENGQ
jgi:hypothetical protein